MNGASFFDAGLLDRRLVLERNEPVADAMGGATPHWQDVTGLSARVEPLRSDVRERFGQHVGMLTHRVTIRHRDGVDRGMAFRWGERRLMIRTIQDMDGRGRFLVCRCEEEA